MFSTVFVWNHVRSIFLGTLLETRQTNWTLSLIWESSKINVQLPSSSLFIFTVLCLFYQIISNDIFWLLHVQVFMSYDDDKEYKNNNNNKNVNKINNKK